MEKLSEFLKLNVFRDDAPIPDTIIEKYVKEIVVDKDNFIWKLNPSIGQADNLLIEMDRDIKKIIFIRKLCIMSIAAQAAINSTH